MEWDSLISNTPRCLVVCDYNKIKEQHEARTLELADLINCYRPQCDSNNNELYTIKQCSFHFNEWCWCSTQHGQAFPETFQKNMPDDFCSKLSESKLIYKFSIYSYICLFFMIIANYVIIANHCHVDGKDYEIGMTFTPPSVCGKW